MRVDTPPSGDAPAERAARHDKADQADPPFHLFADSIDQLAWIAHADGWIYWYNQSWYGYTGTTPEQMEGWGWQSVHDPAKLAGVMKQWQASIASGEAFDMIFPLRGSDGSFRSFLTRARPYKDAGGNVLKWFGTNTDISRELESAAALRQSEARFRTANEAVNAVLWTNSPDGQMTGEQPGWSAFTGQTPEQYQGYGWSAAVHHEDAQPTIAAWERSVSTRSLFAFEHRVRRRDGVFRLCSIRALPILDQAGNVTEWVGVHTDITEERETQRTLRETVTALNQQQELLEAAQLITNVGFWRYMPKSPFLYLSAGTRHLLGLSTQGEVTFDQAMDRIHPDDHAGIAEALRDAFVSGNFQAEFRVLPTVAGGESRWVRGVAQTLTSAEGAPYLVGMNIDITQQKRSAEVLMRTEKLAVAGRLAASIAHEINNPLEAITNLIYLLSSTPLDAEQTHMTELLQSEIERVSHIATHTLRFHRQNTNAAHFPAADLLDSVLALYEGRIRNIGVTVERRMNASRPVFGLEGDLRQVLANLVGNAIDAMQSIRMPRTLHLRSHDAADPRNGRPGVRITVADHGTGIDAEHLTHIFEPFFTTKAETGTGLGLWVSWEIVGKHHGSLRVRSSQNPNCRGTVFQLFLPGDA